MNLFNNEVNQMSGCERKYLFITKRVMNLRYTLDFPVSVDAF